MKSITIVVLLMLSLSSNAQFKKDGTPDLRYKVNRSSNIYSSSSINSDDIYQSGYIKSNGTYVEPSYRTRSNSTNTDNYSTEYNTNPYNNKIGTRARDYSIESNNYGIGKTIYEGARGGQYYINDNGSKIYVPKRNNIY